MPRLPAAPAIAGAQDNSAVEVRDALNEATDALNAALQRAEEALTRCGFGVSANVPLYVDIDEDGRERFFQLGFTKFDRRWSLVVWSCDDEGFSNSTETPLLNASKEARLRAASRLPELYAGLKAEAEKQKSEFRTAIAEVDAFIQSLPVGRAR